jgi:cell division protein FtsI/penicillin-binding protein 2
MKSHTSPAGDAPGRARVGDAFLQGRVDLAQKTTQGGAYRVPLGEGRIAVLTLDPALQRRAEELLAKAHAPLGAIVVVSTDGRLLAMAGLSLEDPERSVKLALTPWAPAASIFKIVTSAALLHAGVLPEATVCTHGGKRSIEASHLRDDPRRDTSCQSLSFALATSQNAVFAKLAARHLDTAGLEAWGKTLGFGTAPRFALPAVPSTLDLPTAQLDFARAAAGFWHSHLTPLDGALLASAVATGGLAVSPRIVGKVLGPDGLETPILAPAPRRVLSAENAALLTTMLVGTTEKGTARGAFYSPRGSRFLGDVIVAGKTGSLSRPGNDPYLHYSWFVGFAPADAPQVVVSVVLGNSARWRLKANTVARMLLQTAFKR